MDDYEDVVKQIETEKSSAAARELYLFTLRQIEETLTRMVLPPYL